MRYTFAPKRKTQEIFEHDESLYQNTKVVSMQIYLRGLTNKKNWIISEREKQLPCTENSLCFSTINVTFNRRQPTVVYVTTAGVCTDGCLEDKKAVNNTADDYYFVETTTTEQNLFCTRRMRSCKWNATKYAFAKLGDDVTKDA